MPLSNRSCAACRGGAGSCTGTITWNPASGRRASGGWPRSRKAAGMSWRCPLRSARRGLGARMRFTGRRAGSRALKDYCGSLPCIRCGSLPRREDRWPTRFLSRRFSRPLRIPGHDRWDQCGPCCWRGGRAAPQSCWAEWMLAASSLFAGRRMFMDGRPSMVCPQLDSRWSTGLSTACRTGNPQIAAKPARRLTRISPAPIISDCSPATD